MTQRIRIVAVFNIVPIVILFIYYYSSFVRILVSPLVPLLALVYWIVLSSTIESSFKSLQTKDAKMWLIYMTLCFFYSVIGYSENNVNYQLNNLCIFFIPIIGVFVLHNYNRNEMKLLLILASAVYFANIVQNIVIWRDFPDLFEDELDHSEEIRLYKNLMNVTATNVVTTSLAVLGTLFTAIMSVNNKFLKLIFIAAVFIVGIFMFVVNARATAIFLSALMVIGFYFANQEPMYGKRIYYFSRIMLVLIIGYIVAVPLLSFVLPYVTDEKLAKRFSDVLSFLLASGDINKTDSGSFSGRWELSQVSINSWLSSPISFLFGIGEHAVDFDGDLRKSGIGGHSEWFDMLAKFGIMGALIFSRIVKNYYQTITSLCTNDNILKYVRVIVLVFFVYGFFNGIFHHSCLLYMFLLFPVIIKLLQTENSDY